MSVFEKFGRDLLEIYAKATDRQKAIMDSYAIAAIAWSISGALSLSNEQCLELRNTYVLHLANAVDTDSLISYLKSKGIENSDRVLKGMDAGINILFDEE